MQWTLLCFCFTLAISAASAGIVQGAKACPMEGSGTFIEMELTSHNLGEADCIAAPCQIWTDAQNASYQLALRFTAGEPASEVFFEVWFLRPDGGVTPLVRQPEDVLLSEGQIYDAFSDFVMPERFNGVAGDLSILIVNRETEGRIICGEFPILVSDEVISKEILQASALIPRPVFDRLH